MNSELVDATETHPPLMMQGTSASVDPLLALIERVVMDPNLPMERINAIMDMQQRQLDKEAEQVFNRDFAAAMAEMRDVPKSGKGHTNTYSTLDDLIRTTRPVLARHGLSLNWVTANEGQNIVVTAVVRHSMGHSIQSTLSGPRDSGKYMNVLQGGGSTETYLKRYSGFGILGLSSGDEVENDGKGNPNQPHITEEQYVELREMIEKAGITEEIVCMAENVGFLPEMPAKMFSRVRSELKVTIEKKVKAA